MHHFKMQSVQLLDGAIRSCSGTAIKVLFFKIQFWWCIKYITKIHVVKSTLGSRYYFFWIHYFHHNTLHIYYTYIKSFCFVNYVIEGHKLYIEQLLLKRLDLSHLHPFGSHLAFFLPSWRLLAALHFTIVL